MNGTFLNGERIEPERFYELLPKVCVCVCVCVCMCVCAHVCVREKGGVKDSDRSVSNLIATTTNLIATTTTKGVCAWVGDRAQPRSL